MWFSHLDSSEQVGRWFCKSGCDSDVSWCLKFDKDPLVSSKINHFWVTSGFPAFETFLTLAYHYAQCRFMLILIWLFMRSPCHFAHGLWKSLFVYDRDQIHRFPGSFLLHCPPGNSTYSPPTVSGISLSLVTPSDENRYGDLCDLLDYPLQPNEGPVAGQRCPESSMINVTDEAQKRDWEVIEFGGGDPMQNASI